MKASRRNIIKSAPLLAAGTIAGAARLPKAHAADRAGTKYNFGHTEDFGTQYYTRMTEILENVRRTEMGMIGDLSSRMADTIKGGNEVWFQAHEGHMGRFENDEKLPGNPGIIRSMNGHEWGRVAKEKLAAMKKGDIFVTNHVSEEIRDARERGVHVVGVPVNYIDNEWTPRGFVHPNKNDWLLGDVTNEILQSYIPYTQGIVDIPQIPELKVLPSSANSLYSIFWSFQCEVANKVKNRKAAHIDKSQIVMDTILERIHDAYRLQKDYMWDHAGTVAKMIGSGGHYHVTTDNPAVQEESNRVANGPMMTNAFREIIRFDGRTMGADDMKKGDVYLLATIEPDSKKIVDEAKKAKEMGMFTVVIGPGSCVELRRYADCFIDNLNPEGTGLMEIDGFDQRVGSLGSVLNNVMMWIFTAQFIDEMVRRGNIPWFYIGYYQIGGGPYDQSIKRFFDKQGF